MKSEVTPLPGSLKYLVILFLAYLFILPLQLAAQNENSVAGDLQALVDLYNSTNGDQWTNNTGWLNGNPSNNWYGVEVNADGRVIKLDLFKNNLTGTLPASIGNLTKLTFINVKHNNLGGKIPPSIGNLESIVYLLLAGAAHNDNGNNPTGIPALNDDHYPSKVPWSPKNQFTGSLPSEIGNLTTAEWIDISRCSFDGTSIPPSLNNLNALKGLFINQNGFTGILPDLGNLINLDNLQIIGGDWDSHTDGYDKNDPELTGPIPSSLGNLINLRYIRMSGHGFSSSIPSGFQNFDNLEGIVMDHSGISGEFFSILLAGNVKPLNNIIITNNNITEDLGSVNFTAYNFSTFRLNNNNFFGSIPPELFSMGNMIILNVANNNLTGTIPNDWTGMGNIRNVRLNGNSLSGSLPQLLPNSKMWTNFEVGDNNFTGEFPPLGNIDNANNPTDGWNSIWLNDLKLTGQLPSNYTNLTPTDLRLHLENNPLTFKDLLPTLPLMISNYKGDFGYKNLKPFGKSQNITVAPAGRFTIDFSDISHPEDKYQWTKDGEPIPGATSVKLDIGSVSNVDEGVYRLEITNPNLPEIATLVSNPVELRMGNDSNMPGTPSLNSPQDGATDVITIPTLSWNSAGGADTYGLQIATDINFNNLVRNLDSLTSTSKDVTGLSNNTTYYWRVNATNNYGTGSWSPIWKFTTESGNDGGGNNIPGTPSLNSPQDGATDVITIPTLSWNSAGGADTYGLQIATDINFNNLVRNLDNLTSTSKDVTGLSNNTTYYWKVNATNNYGTGSWSPIWKFTTSATSSTPAIPAPVQLSPNNQAGNISLKPTFEWESVDGADYYILHARRLNPSEMVIQVEVERRMFTPKNFSPETSYLWRVRAVKNGTEGEWSPEWEFTTGPGDEAETRTNLDQNYPNPFNPSTQIRFNLGETQEVSLKVYDIGGRLVAILLEGTLEAGSHESTFRADNLASGVYFYHFVTENRIFTRKMTLMK